jgi:hypothetical protein
MMHCVLLYTRHRHKLRFCFFLSESEFAEFKNLQNKTKRMVYINSESDQIIIFLLVFNSENSKINYENSDSDKKSQKSANHDGV